MVLYFGAYGTLQFVSLLSKTKNLFDTNATIRNTYMYNSSNNQIDSNVDVGIKCNSIVFFTGSTMG